MKYDTEMDQACLEDGPKPTVAIGKNGLSTVKLMRAVDVFDRVTEALRVKPDLAQVSEWPEGMG